MQWAYIVTTDENTNHPLLRSYLDQLDYCSDGDPDEFDLVTKDEAVKCWLYNNPNEDNIKNILDIIKYDLGILKDVRPKSIQVTIDHIPIEIWKKGKFLADSAGVET